MRQTYKNLEELINNKNTKVEDLLKWEREAISSEFGYKYLGEETGRYINYNYKWIATGTKILHSKVDTIINNFKNNIEVINWVNSRVGVNYEKRINRSI